MFANIAICLDQRVYYVFIIIYYFYTEKNTVKINSVHKTYKNIIVYVTSRFVSITVTLLFEYFERHWTIRLLKELDKTQERPSCRKDTDNL